MQEAFLKVVEREPITPIAQPLAYLVRMVRNLAIDHYRRQAFEGALYASEDEGLEVASPWGSPESNVIHRDLLGRVSDALAQLPVRTRAAFEMVRINDMTLKEAACVLGVSQTLVHFMVKAAADHCMSSVD